MMLLLILEVGSHAGELLLAKADYAEASLPLQPFESSRLVYFIRARPLQVADQVADANVTHQLKLVANRYRLKPAEGKSIPRPADTPYRTAADDLLLTGRSARDR